jgi:hypothetical protein
VSYTITAYLGVSSTGMTLTVAAPTTNAYFTGLTEGLTYTFTVFATNSVGDSPESVHSNAVTISRQSAQSSPVPTPPRDGSNPVPTASPGQR